MFQEHPFSHHTPRAQVWGIFVQKYKNKHFVNGKIYNEFQPTPVKRVEKPKIELLTIIYVKYNIYLVIKIIHRQDARYV